MHRTPLEASTSHMLNLLGQMTLSDRRSFYNTYYTNFEAANIFHKAVRPSILRSLGRPYPSFLLWIFCSFCFVTPFCKRNYMNEEIVTRRTYIIIFSAWYFCQILNKIYFYDIFLLELPNIRFHENLSRVAWDILCALTKLQTERRRERQSFRHDEANCLFSHFRGLV